MNKVCEEYTKKEMIKVSIITPAHNEEETILACLLSVQNLAVPSNLSVEHLVVADRCSDRTMKICMERNVRVVEKNWKGNAIDPVTEVVELGVNESEGEIMGKVDADIILPKNWLVETLKHFDDDTVSVASRVKTRSGKWWLDFFMALRDLNYRVTPLGEEPRGAARLIDRVLLERIGGFDYNWASWDTGLDARVRAAGYRSVLVKDVCALEYRPSMTVSGLVSKQIEQGAARRRMGSSLIRTIGHSLFRLRPFVLWGYVMKNEENTRDWRSGSPRLAPSQEADCQGVQRGNCRQLQPRLNG